MSAELYVDEGAARPLRALEAVPAEPSDRARPHVSGDLPTLFQAAPMFRRAVSGYDRFQVDTYVQWAEDELATADREREHLMARHLRTRAELDEARQLLSHSSGGGEMLQASRRIGSLLAAAADEAESIRTEAEAHRSAAAAEAKLKLGYARWRIAYADSHAMRTVAEAATKAEEMTAAAAVVVDDAERAAREIRAEASATAAARLAEVRATERRAATEVRRIRQRAVEEASVAVLQARNEVVRMLSTGREERRRADAEAAATRECADRVAAARLTALLAEVAALEDRRAVLAAEVQRLSGPVAETSGGWLRRPLGQLHERLSSRPRFLRTP